MKMKNKYEILLGVIDDALEYRRPFGIKTLHIPIYHEKLLSEGLDDQDIKLGFERMAQGRVVLKKIHMFAPHAPQPTYPKRPNFVSSPDKDYDKPVYILEIDTEKFDAIAPKPDGDEKETIENTTKPKISLKSMGIKYDDDKALLYIGTQNCQIPPYKNEHFLCRAMYEYRASEPIDWSKIYEGIVGYYKAFFGKPPATRENWRVVYDAMDALNKRIKEVCNTDDELFTWQEKTIKRNY